MLRFFRTIRRNYFDKGATAKYLLYAIGEIFLVVVGILIALQINNWNEQRKDRELEVKILKQLQADLKDNLREIVGIRNSVEGTSHSLDTISIYFQEERPVDDYLRSRFQRIRAGRIYNSANTAYRFIENSGFNVISNDSLRVSITEMYETYFNNIRTRQVMEDRVKLEALPAYMQKHFRSYRFSDRDHATNSVDPINIEFVRSDPEFINILNRLQNIERVRIRWLDETISELQILIQNLELEIQRLNN